MNSLSSFIRLFLLFALGLFIALFFYLSLYLPKKQVLENLQHTISASEQKLLSIKHQKENLKMQIIQKQTKSLDLPETLVKQFPITNDMPLLLSSLTQKGREIGIEFLLFEPMSENEFGTLIEMPIRVTLRGTFHQTLTFFNYLSKLERKILISNIEMTQPEKKRGNYVVSTHARVTTFRRSTGQP